MGYIFNLKLYKNNTKTVTVLLKNMFMTHES